jgi:hypothetical protein
MCCASQDPADLAVLRVTSGGAFTGESGGVSCCRGPAARTSPAVAVASRPLLIDEHTGHHPCCAGVVPGHQRGWDRSGGGFGVKARVHPACAGAVLRAIRCGPRGEVPLPVEVGCLGRILVTLAAGQREGAAPATVACMPQFSVVHYTRHMCHWQSKLSQTSAAVALFKARQLRRNGCVRPAVVVGVPQLCLQLVGFPKQRVHDPPPPPHTHTHTHTHMLRGNCSVVRCYAD